MENEYTEKKLQQGMKAVEEMNNDIVDLGKNLIGIAIELTLKWPKDEITFMQKMTEKFSQGKENDLFIIQVNNTIIEILKLANQIRKK